MLIKMLENESYLFSQLTNKMWKPDSNSAIILLFLRQFCCFQ